MQKINYKEHYYNNIEFSEALLSGKGSIFVPETIKSSFSFPHMNEYWNDEHFKSNNNPSNVGTVLNQELFH